MKSRLLHYLALFVVSKKTKWGILGLLAAIVAIVVLLSIGIIAAKVVQILDDDPDRGALAVTGGAFGESYEVPEYLDQGWKEWQSL